MKHTPGPWKIREVSENDGEFDIFIPDEFGDADAVIAQIAGGLGRVSDDDRCYESEANARLIASAPELLEALQEAANELHGLWGDGEVCTEEKPCMYCAAIARAEGE